MICPYCNKQINDNNQFCPGCGQILTVSSDEGSIYSYWNTVNKSNAERNREYKDNIELEVKKTRDRRQKKILIAAILLISIMMGAYIFCIYCKNQEIRLEGIKNNLINNTYEIKKNGYETMGHQIDRTWKLTFQTEGKVEYWYSNLVDGEVSRDSVKNGIYTYDVNWPLGGPCYIKINNEAFYIRCDRLGNIIEIYK